MASNDATYPPAGGGGGGGGGGVQYDVGDVAGATDTGTMALAVRNDAGTPLAADGEYIPLSINASGELRVASSGGGGGTQYDVGDAAGATDTGTLALLVRDDALTTLSDADGDYVQGRVTSVGRLWTSAVIDTALPAGNNNIGDVDVASLPAITGSVTVSGSVTANAGTNLNTSLLALESGGNLAAAAASLAILDNIVSGSEAQVDIVAALPAGTNNIGDVDVASIAAGTNLIGDVAINGRATGSAVSVVRFVSGASTNLTAVKASAGTLYGFSISNIKSSAVFVRFYNIASGSVTVGTSTVFAGPFIGPGATTGAGHTFTFPLGIPFSNAGWSVSITAGSLADNDTTATAASDCAISIFYV